MEYFSTVMDGVALGLSTALLPHNLLYCFLGVLLGMFVGVLPGIGALSAISILFPVTFYMDPTTALIMLAGIWYGAGYGGSVASILLNVPGTTASAVACLDGYPMAQQGRAGIALSISAIGSFIGGSIGILLMMLFSPGIVVLALKFGAQEMFSIMLLGLVAASTISEGSPAKGMAMVVLGALFGTVGMDIYTGQSRLTFGFIGLSDGMSLLALAMGIFAVAEVIASAGKVESTAHTKQKITLRSLIPTREDLRRSWMPIMRGTALGSFFGTLPGTGPSVASFISYATEKKVARNPERFGKGAVEGVAGPEAANNAADQTAFIPTMSLGIPGSATMAIMLGALIIHGIQPGPAVIINHPDLFWGLVMSFWIGNLILVVLSIPLIGIWVRVVLVPYNLLYPAILLLVCIGVFSVSNSNFDVWLVVFFGLIGYLMRLLAMPAAPMLLGFVLGPMMEENFRRSLIISHGDFMTFIERPTSAIFLAITFILLVAGIVASFRGRKSPKGTSGSSPASLAAGERLGDD